MTLPIYELKISEKMNEESEIISNFRNKMMNNFVTHIEGCSLNGHPEKRLPNNLNMSFDFTDSQRILISLLMECM